MKLTIVLNFLRHVQRIKLLTWTAVAETWRRVWGGQKKCFADQDDDFFRKNFHFSGKNFWWPFISFSFLVIYQVFRIFNDFPDLYFVKCPTWPFPRKENTFYYSFHTFAHIRQHCFSKYWGGTNAWAVPHLKLWGDRPPSPPRFPPLMDGQDES